MCLGVPGKIIKKWKDSKTKVAMALVDYGGIKRDICLVFNPDVNINEYVMTHVGFAISKIDEKAAKETLKLFKKQDKLEEEVGVK